MTADGNLIGRRVRRVEDPALVSGRGQYAGDHRPPGLVHLAFFRSPYAHARVVSLNLEAARRAPGVVAAWAASDLPELAAGMGDTTGRAFRAHARPLLAAEVARYQGEPLAAVVAGTAYQAADAVGLVEAELEPLPAAATLEDALSEGAPLVHEDMESNVVGATHAHLGDVDAAFEQGVGGSSPTEQGAGGSSPTGQGAVVVSATFRVPRICGGYLEPRAAAATFEDGRLTIWASTQWTFGIRDRAAALLGLDPESVRVLAVDVGGGFGPKGEVYPEDVVVGAAARRLGRAVRWVASRSEDTMATAHAHGTRIEAELAADPDGRLRGLRARLVHDAGAYTGSGVGQPDIMGPHMLSAYRLPAFSYDATVVHTNTVPTGFVRGGGRPVGNFVVERLMDQLADRLGRERVDVRRQNLVQPDQVPYDTRLPAGRTTVVYDSGDFPRLVAEVEAALAGVREGPREDGRITGGAIVCCVESSAFGRREPGRARLERDGRARLFVGSTPQGQGHRTVAAQVFAERLGWPMERVEVTAGDTAGVDWALLTAGSRSAVQVGNAAAMAGRSLRRRLLEQAAETLEADPADLVMDQGRISVRGAPARSVDAVGVLPDDGLEVFEHFDPSAPLTYPSGCHGAVVALDPETGSIEVERYVIAHDTGRPVNPMLVEGQMQGGFAHGIGYALFEEVVYTPEGSLATASFLDYSIPSAPEITAAPELHPLTTMAGTNPEGFKGAGESGTIPVPAAVAAAVERAVRHVNPDAQVRELPLTPERVLGLLRREP